MIFNNDKKIIFASFYFVFLLPVWGVLTTPLQQISIEAVSLIMGLTNIPVYVENTFIHIPSGTFEIAGGCSGLRYLLTSLAISSLFSFLYLRNVKSTVIFVWIAIMGALLTNWLRIIALIVIGHQTDMTSSLMEDHNFFGWYIYAPFMLLLFKLGNHLSDKNVNINDSTEKTTKKNTTNWKITAVICAGLLLSSTTLTMSEIAKPEIVKTELHPKIRHYSSAEIVISSAKTTYIIYDFKGDNLEEKPTFYENNFIPSTWQVLTKDVYNDEQKFKIRKGLKTAIVTISFQIADKKIGSSSKFKLERLKQALFGIKNTQLHWKFQFI